jgi:cysteine desulfurase
MISMASHAPIYLDYQATAPLDPRVLAAMLPFLSGVVGNPHAGEHLYGQQAAEAVARARASVAHSIGARAKEIVFTSGATEANNLLLRGGAQLAAASGRPRIVTAATEHKAVLDVVQALAREKAPVTILPVGADGLIDPGQLEAALTDDVGLVSLMAVNNEIGTIHPIPQVGELCRKRGILLHSDAAQAACKIEIDVAAWQVDLLSLSSHKLYGPAGIGAAYIRGDLLRRWPPLLHGGGQERGIRPGTLPTALCVGFGEACRLALEGRQEEEARLLLLRDRLLARLDAGGLDFIVNGSLHCRWPGNLNLSFAGVDGEALMMTARPDLAIATGSACTTTSLEPSHVVAALGGGLDRSESAVRVGLGRYTTEQEVDKTAAILIEAVGRLTRVNRLAVG